LKSSIFSINYENLLDILRLDKNFRVRQILDSIIKNKNFDFNDITNIPKDIRNYLSDNFYVLDVVPYQKLESSDGTIKFLFELNDSSYVESVYLKDKNNRVTFCVSSQVGCRMGCIFCKTGKMGLIRNLTATEIISQILYLTKVMVLDKNVVDTSFNIVFMGMGEPLDNFEELVKSIKIITDKNYFGITEHRITVSTSGLIKKIPELLKVFPSINLAVSLTSADNEKRINIMPVTKSNPLRDLSEMLISCYNQYNNRITLEYVLIKNFNMSDDDIKSLKIFNHKAFHLNLIPLNSENENEIPGEYEIKIFMEKLEKNGFCITRRYRRGEDIKADCGQLYWANKKND
jgi:23S rRNA (adenine2503-C2)-methyltransferase